MIRMLSSDRVVICGLPRTGKTTLAKHFASSAGKNLYIIDPLNQYGEFDKIIPKGNRVMPEPGKEMLVFESVCRRLCQVTNHRLLLEECEDYLGQGLMLPPFANRVIRQGRNWGIGIVAITQRLPEISKRFFDRCQHIFFFRCGVYSQTYIEDRIGRTKAEKVFKLSIDRHEFMHYDVGADTAEIYALKFEGAAEYAHTVEALKQGPVEAEEQKEKVNAEARTIGTAHSK